MRTNFTDDTFFINQQFRGVLIKRHELAIIIKLDYPILEIPFDQIKKEGSYNFYNKNSDLLRINICNALFEKTMIGDEVLKNFGENFIYLSKDQSEILNLDPKISAIQSNVYL